MRRIGYYLLHHILDLGKLVHQVDLIMQATRRIDQHHIRIIGFCALQGIKGHTGGVGALLLFDNRHTYAFAPNTQLLHRSGTESIGSAEIDFFARSLVLMCKFTDGSGLTHSIDTHYHNHIRFAWQGVIEIGYLHIVVLSQQGCHLFYEYLIEFGSTEIFISLHTLLHSFDDTQGGLHAHIRSDERFLQIIQHIIIHGGFTRNSMRDLAEYRLFCLLQSFV